MKTVHTVVTPEMAKEWLQKNTRNRNISQRKVDSYAVDMKNGNWHEHHQGIAFYFNGEVADGQHRLEAIVKSGVSVLLMVTFGIPIESAIGIDVHRARKTDDVLRITGQSAWIGKDESAIIKMIMTAGNQANNAPSPSVVAEFGERNREAIEFAGTGLSRSQVRYITAAPIRSAIACAYHAHGPDELRRFHGVLVSGIMNSPDDAAAIRLRERMLIDGPMLGHGSSARLKAMKLAMRAIKAFFNKEQIGKLVEPQGFPYPILK
jgi:hypothetical protein